MPVIVLDTDVASRIIKQSLPASLARRLIGQQPAITFVTVGELAKWSTIRKHGERRRALIKSWTDTQATIGGSPEVGRTWGEITAYAQLRGRPRPVNDSWIAACCLAYRLPLATLNVADYEDFAEYEGLEIVTT